MEKPYLWQILCSCQKLIKNSLISLHMVIAYFLNKTVQTEQSADALLLYEKSRFGTVKNKSVVLSLLETTYLLERQKITVVDGRNKPIDFGMFFRKASKQEQRFSTRYTVFSDLRDKGYIVKTALKFGADFRVYDRGAKPGERHARWVVYPVHETERFTWQDFSAKNRVAHSTKKKLLLGVVDDEQAVSYWEAGWIKP